MNDGKRPSEDREQVRERLLHSLHEQLSNFLCFTPEEKVYNYEDPTARKTMQDALQLRYFDIQIVLNPTEYRCVFYTTDNPLN